MVNAISEVLKIDEIDFGCASNILIRNHLLRNKYMAIYCALLKHGYSNFSLTILEYCSPDKRLIREKHYWDLLNPEYNIAKEPGAPMRSRKHSDKTNKRMSDAKIDDKISDKTQKKKSCRMLIKGRIILIMVKLCPSER